MTEKHSCFQRCPHGKHVRPPRSSSHVALGCGCCYCYWSSKACPADVTPRPVQVRGPREMADRCAGCRTRHLPKVRRMRTAADWPRWTCCCNCCCAVRAEQSGRSWLSSTGGHSWLSSTGDGCQHRWHPSHHPPAACTTDVGRPSAPSSNSP